MTQEAISVINSDHLTSSWWLYLNFQHDRARFPKCRLSLLVTSCCFFYHTLSTRVKNVTMLTVIFCLSFVLAALCESRVPPLHDPEALTDRELILQLARRVSSLELDNERQQLRIEQLEDTATQQAGAIVELERKLDNEKKLRQSDQMKETDFRHKEIITEPERETEGALEEQGISEESDNKLKSGKSRRAMVITQKDGSSPVLRQVSGSTDPRAAFSVLLQPNLNHLGANQNLVFDTVYVDTAGAYHPNHGVYTVPVTGVYLISTTVLANQNREVWCDIVVNGAVKAQLYARGTDNRHDQGSQTILLHLKKGDDVSVQNDAVDDSIYGSLYTSFTGFLLFEEEAPQVVGR